MDKLQKHEALAAGTPEFIFKKTNTSTLFWFPQEGKDIYSAPVHPLVFFSKRHQTFNFRLAA